jgi:homoserine kinase type II
MAAFTQLSDADIVSLTGRFVTGPAEHWEPTSGGIENTNYFVDTAADGDQPAARWVLTRIEQPGTDVEGVARWLCHLKDHGLPVPAPAPLRDAGSGSRWVTTHGGQPVLLCQRLPGSHCQDPGVAECAAAGSFLARLHLAGAPAGCIERPHTRSLAWLADKAARLRPGLPVLRRRLLEDALERQHYLAAREDYRALPRGALHGDLFHDNALFSGDRLTGVIDFYHAAREVQLFDLAVVINDWCVDLGPTVGLRWPQILALLEAYHTLRPLSAFELTFLPLVCELSALRFWMARALPDDGSAPRKDPDEMARILERHAATRFPDPAWLRLHRQLGLKAPAGAALGGGATGSEASRGRSR